MTETRDWNIGGIRLAAGGLVYRTENGRELLSIVRRTKHGDWVLPKGKPEAGEALADTACREAQEESGMRVERKDFAGTYSYEVDGLPKVVLVWHLRAMSEPFAGAAGQEEIAERLWVDPSEALARLSHPTERAFLARHLNDSALARPAFVEGKAPREKLDRLAAALQTLGEQFDGMVARQNAQRGVWWAESARRSLRTAHAAWAAGCLDAGWGALHDAERFLVFGYDDNGLLAHATRIRAEALDKVRGWRSGTISSLFAAVPLDEWRKSGGRPDGWRPALEAATVEALELLHGHSDNVYHRVRLVERQMKWMVLWCLGAMTTVLIASVQVEMQSMFHFHAIAPVLIAGAFGGVLSALFQLSRVGEKKIPEALLHGLITSGRPLIGTVSALFIHVVLRAGIINLPDPASDLSLALTVSFAFAAGFTDRLVLSSIGKLTGSEDLKEGRKPK